MAGRGARGERRSEQRSADRRHASTARPLVWTGSLLYKDTVTRRPFAVPALLLVLLVWAQMSLAAHRLDAAAHVTGEHCEWCVAGTSLHGALPASMSPVAIVTVNVLIQIPVATTAFPVFYARYRTRAPPHRFS